ncbi:DUF5674 family protein [Candidatus Parcubacteria bacterium]|nr:DUF5674 family protein [Candidatus Parcubacteria bacterium]
MNNKRQECKIMKIIKEKITLQELAEMSEKMFDNLVKAVVDLEKEIMAVDGDLHADEYTLLIENGSEPQGLWGINLYPNRTGGDFIEFDSMINIRPHQGNKSRGIEDEKTQKRIKEIVSKLVKT